MIYSKYEEKEEVILPIDMEAVIEIFDDEGIKTDISNTCAFIEFWTDYAGQDINVKFLYDGTAKDFIKEFTSQANNYDVDEEVQLYVGNLGKNGVPDTVRDLLNDCEEAKDTLMHLASRLEKEINIFESSLNEEIQPEENYDIWGVATCWCQNIGAEYNYCVDNGINESAIYAMYGKEEEEYTDYNDFEHYEINFDDPHWQDKLLRQMEKFVAKRIKQAN